VTDPATDLSGRLDASLRTIAAVARAPAVVLATVVGEETMVACHGDPAPDAHTVFELGSITKTFTALLLAEMVTRGEVDYDDPITACLPPEARPRRGTDAPITLVQLATHTAGLPRLPANLYLQALPVWWTNPYSRYRLEDLYLATDRTRAGRHPGAPMHYSDFGVGLLGQLLANAAAADYRDLVLDRVCRPLGMTDTSPGPDRCAPPVIAAAGRCRRGRWVPSPRRARCAPAPPIRCAICKPTCTRRPPR
jgi:D-alanyl-D-alanine-carboxypeptidase/D-alanyl-D-alanine-endopeptidase